MNLKQLQEKIKEFVEKNHLDSEPDIRFIDLVSEIGEVGKEILKSTDYGKSPLKKSKELELELGDALYSLVVLANKLDINLDEALNLVLNKYEQRLLKGSAGSEVENK